MATLLKETDRDAGIEAVYNSSLKFMRRHDFKINFPLTRNEAKIVLRELWTGLGDLDFRSLLSGTAATDLPENYLRLLVYATIKKQFEQFESTLPNLTMNIRGA